MSKKHANTPAPVGTEAPAITTLSDSPPAASEASASSTLEAAALADQAAAGALGAGGEPPASPTPDEVRQANRALYEALPEALRQSIETAVDLASTDLVNLETAAEFLRGSHGDSFDTIEDARDAIRHAADLRT
jgi:hypothetical protein